MPSHSTAPETAPADGPGAAHGYIGVNPLRLPPAPHAGPESVVGSGLQADEFAQRLCREITAFHRRAFAIQADVSVAAEVKRMVAEVESRLGAVDVLVNAESD